MKLLIAFLCLFTSLGAQTIPVNQLQAEIQKGLSFEARNDLDQALHIYQKIYAQYPSRGDIAMRIESIYSRIGQYDKAVALLTQHLKQSPNDITIHLKLGDALFALGKKPEAFAQWNGLLKNATSPNIFAIVADRYRKNSIYDQAEAIYRQSRTALNMPELFAQELAELAERQAHYATAVREYIIFIRQKPQYRTMIEARLRDMAQNDEQRPEIFGLLSNEVLKEPNNHNNLSLLMEYALPAGFSAQILPILQNTAHLPANSWTYLPRIARYALEEKKFEIAAQAYQTLYNRIEQPDVRARALLGLAQTKQTAQDIGQARQYYQAVVDQFPSRPEADEARFRLGIFQRDTDQNLKDAQQTFIELINTNRQNEWRYHAFFELADGYLQTDQFENAAKTWTTILSERKIGPEAARARYAIAELHYYTGDFDAAKVMLNLILVKDLEQNVANDAIMKLALIEESEQKDIDHLRQYAQAECLHRQQKLKEAQTTLEKLIQQYPKTFLADRILYRQAELLEQQKQYTQAIQQYRKLVLTQKDSPLCPASQMALAQIYEIRLSQYHEAKSAYETLLVTYPLSFEADLARDRLRILQQKIQTPKETG
jgi:tetratricopeptide (TPR) repeat protein